MVAEPYVESEKLISNPSDRSQWTERAQGLLSWATSFWVLAIGFVIVTLAAAGPLRVWDYKLNRRWLYLFEPDLVWFFQHILDPIAGQAVCLPVLAITAIVLARKRRSWRPIVFAIAVEAAFYLGIGSLKVLLARPATTLHDPRFFQGGLIEIGGRGISVDILGEGSEEFESGPVRTSLRRQKPKRGAGGPRREQEHRNAHRLGHSQQLGPVAAVSGQEQNVAEELRLDGACRFHMLDEHFEQGCDRGSPTGCGGELMAQLGGDEGGHLQQ